MANDHGSIRQVLDSKWKFSNAHFKGSIVFIQEDRSWQNWNSSRMKQLQYGIDTINVSSICFSIQSQVGHHIRLGDIDETYET